MQFGRGQGGEGDSFRERRRADQGRKEAGLSIQETKDAMGPKGLRERGGRREKGGRTKSGVEQDEMQCSECGPAGWRKDT